MQNASREIATNLLKIKAVTLSVNPPYTWTSGIKAPIYTDNRQIISFPEERKLVNDAFIKVIKEKNLEFDVIAGTASAAVPFASFLAWKLGMPMVYIRHKSKGYGANRQIEGQMKEGARVLIIEDLISTGGSATRSVEICRDEKNANVVGVLAIFTYQMQEAQENFAKVNCPLWTLSNFETLLDVATQMDYLKEEDKEHALAWSKDPTTWGK